MNAAPAPIGDGGAAALAPQRLLGWLTAYERRLAAVGEGACRRLGMEPTPAACNRWMGAREIWLGAPAPLSDFGAGANRLALLDENGLRRVLAAFRLYVSRGALRRVVSGAQRRAMAAAVGEQSFGMLLQLGMRESGAGTALPALVDDGALAAAGHAMVAADGGLNLDVAARLVALTLGREPAGAPDARGESDAFMALAGFIFPEFTWLFG